LHIFNGNNFLHILLSFTRERPPAAPFLDCTGNEGKSAAKGFPLGALSDRNLAAARTGESERALLRPIFLLILAH
jgi:hypothetical protein